MCIIHASCEWLEISKKDAQKFDDFYSAFGHLWGWGELKKSVKNIPFVIKISVVL